MAGTIPHNSSTSTLSPEALVVIQDVDRFTGYLPPDIWPTCRDGFVETMTNDSDAAKELLSSVEEITVGSVRALKLIPKTYKETRKVILYIHGGALTLGKPDCTLQFPSPVANITGIPVISIDYPLAPYAPSDDPHPEHTAALNAYEALLEKHESSEIGILADSAGGTLAFGMSLLARDKGLPLPAAIVAYAPWVDLEQTSKAYSDKEHIDQTVVLTPEPLASARDAAFGKSEKYSPYVSPLKGAYHGFDSVAVAIHTASRDLLNNEGNELAEKLKTNAKCVELISHADMWHGFQQYLELPEAKRCAVQAAEFFTLHL